MPDSPAEQHLAEAVEHYEASSTKEAVRMFLLGLMALNIRPSR